MVQKSSSWEIMDTPEKKKAHLEYLKSIGTRICLKCEEKPAYLQEKGWLPICPECLTEVNSLPEVDFKETSQSLWDKFQVTMNCI